MQRCGFAQACWLSSALLLGACGGSPIGPPVTPPHNNPPVIDAISLQGTRPGEPPNFADVGERVTVTAAMRDDETPLDQLQYEWSAPAGTFVGSGTTVTWQAPAGIAGATDIVLTLRVVEKYGAGAALEHQVTGTATLSLHDSVREVGDMARQFLLDFSDNNRTVDEVMRNFSAAACPQPAEVASERADVTNIRTNYLITRSRIYPADVILGFGGRCPFPDPFRQKKGDACAIVRSAWDSIDKRDNSVGSVDGRDYVAAAYATPDRRWWLCASDYAPESSTGALRWGFIR